MFIVTTHKTPNKSKTHVILCITAGASVNERLDGKLLPLRGHEAHDKV